MSNQQKSKTELPGTGPETPDLAKKTAGEVVFLPQGVPVLGIGASAGGLDAFKLLLGHLPVDTGFAFVLVQHLEPTHPSMLTEILGRVTRMPVVEAADRTAVDPNHVYVIPQQRTEDLPPGTESDAAARRRTAPADRRVPAIARGRFR